MRNNQAMQDKHGILSKPIHQVLIQMTLPMVFGMISVLMFNIVDTYFISKLGTKPLAAISFTFPITFAVNCICMGVGVGISAIVGQLIGRSEFHRAAQFSTHGILLALILIIFASAIGLLTITPLFQLLGADLSTIKFIQPYMQVWYLSVPFLVLPMVGSNAIRARGDTKSPALILFISALTNSLLDPLFIFGIGPFPQLGIQGAALASAISWLTCFFVTSYLLIYKHKIIALPSWQQIIKDWQAILKIGTPAGLSNAMNPLAGAIITIILASYGAHAIAAYGAAQRVESLLLLVMVSLSSILTPFLAQNIGAKFYQRSFKTVVVSMHFALGFQFIIFIAMVPLSQSIADLFTQEGQVKQLIWHYLLIVPITYGCQGCVMILISLFNAMHLSLKAFYWNLARLFIFNLPFAWFGSYFYQVEGVFTGIAIGNLLSGLCAYFYFLHFHKKYLTQVAHSNSKP